MAYSDKPSEVPFQLTGRKRTEEQSNQLCIIVTSGVLSLCVPSGTQLLALAGASALELYGSHCNAEVCQPWHGLRCAFFSFPTMHLISLRDTDRFVVNKLVCGMQKKVLITLKLQSPPQPPNDPGILFIINGQTCQQHCNIVLVPKK